MRPASSGLGDSIASQAPVPPDISQTSAGQAVQLAVLGCPDQMRIRAGRDGQHRTIAIFTVPDLSLGPILPLLHTLALGAGSGGLHPCCDHVARSLISVVPEPIIMPAML